MYKKKAQWLIATCLWFFSYAVFAQEQKIADSLLQVYKRGNMKDTARLALLLDLSYNEVRDLDEGLKYAEQLIDLSQELGNDRYLRAGYALKGTKLRLLGRLAKALESFFNSAELAKKMKNVTAEADSYGEIANIYSIASDHPKARHYYDTAISLLRRVDKPIKLASALCNSGDELRKIKIYDSALLCFQEADSIFGRTNYLSGKGYSLGGLGMIYAIIGKDDLAIKNLNDAILILEENGDYYPTCDYLNSLADVYISKGDYQLALTYALKSLGIAQQQDLPEQTSDASLKLSELYERLGQVDQSLKYYKSHIVARDKVNDIAKERKMAELRYNFDMAQKQQEVNRQRRLFFISLIVLVVILTLLFIVFKNNRQKQKAYTLLSKEKALTEDQRNQTNQALEKLKRAQAHLIQTAKMASLGELTAGIAHEIQNPLNFVNNFSEVNNELLEEMKQELGKENLKDALQIAGDVQQNLEKVIYHGQRANAIVQSMLQHSRASAGENEPANINHLADEFLTLSYQGIRAKHKSFQATLSTDFDDSIGKINIVPQDIGRVFLNLYNNAFYSLMEKKKQDETFEPVISVTTRKIEPAQKDNTHVEIIIRDNGMGIPEKIIDKIYQPFFTTKPTGQGTGLGLSLSYDIIKAHGGEIRIDTKEGEYAEFIIELPNS